MYHYTGSGLSNVWLVNGYTEHDTPYGPSISIIDVEGLHQAIGMEIVNQPQRRMSGEEVRFLRREMDLSQRALADILNLKEITIRKWEDQGCPAGPAQIVLRAAYLGHIRGDDRLGRILEQLRRQDRQDGMQQRPLHFRRALIDVDSYWQRERLAA